MKYLEVRIILSDSVPNEVLNKIGEEFQRTLPCDFEAEDIVVSDITFEVKDYEIPKEN